MYIQELTYYANLRKNINASIKKLRRRDFFFSDGTLEIYKL